MNRNGPHLLFYVIGQANSSVLPVLTFLAFIYIYFLNMQSSPNRSRSRFFDQNMDSVQPNQPSRSPHVPFLAPPPNPVVPITLPRAASQASKDTLSVDPTTELDDDFGDFQTAG